MVVDLFCGAGGSSEGVRRMGGTSVGVDATEQPEYIARFGNESFVLSDALGRRAFMLIGPIGNIIVGTIVFLNHTNLPVVLVCRVIKQMITTFSNTVIATASLTDFLSGQELARGFGQLGGMYGAALFIGPVIETQMLRLTGTPRFACA